MRKFRLIWGRKEFYFYLSAHIPSAALTQASRDQGPGIEMPSKQYRATNYPLHTAVARNFFLRTGTSRIQRQRKAGRTQEQEQQPIRKSRLDHTRLFEASTRRHVETKRNTAPAPTTARGAKQVQIPE